MVTRDELATHIKNMPWGSSEIIADKLLAKYDITEKPLMPLKSGDIFRRVNGLDTIVWNTEQLLFLGVHPRTPTFCSFFVPEKWILLARYGQAVKVEDQFVIMIDENGLRIG